MTEERPLTPAQVEGKLRLIVRELDALMDQLAAFEDELAESTYAYEHAYLTAYNTARFAEGKSSEKDRDNEAKLKASGERRSMLVAESKAKTARTKVAVLRDQMSALQTLTRMVAAEAGLDLRRP